MTFASLGCMRFMQLVSATKVPFSIQAWKQSLLALQDAHGNFAMKNKKDSPATYVSSPLMLRSGRLSPPTDTFIDVRLFTTSSMLMLVRMHPEFSHIVYGLCLQPRWSIHAFTPSIHSFTPSGNMCAFMGL